MEPSNNSNRHLESAPSVMRYKILSHARIKLRDGEFHRITVRDLCSNLNISRVTFYYHFRSKQHLLDELILNVQEEGIEKMRGKEYAEAISVMVQHISENKTIFRNILVKKTTPADTIAFSRTLATIIQREFERQRKFGRKIDFDTELAAIFVTGGIVYILSHWVSDGYKYTSKEVEDCLLGEFKGRISLFSTMAKATLK